ncbi:hypothetical protein IW261DRAFT_1575392 [Armillaria novae-zelandiae]|uniref:Uncharacterized protein n=1 Tax=Armillaria novae-zelandiae TaxID=153914 RepID=A0AA39T4I3_9AGAR|nr:hypothetical protein IW261DRAFT_1575392 [Armillaria novae-zelandiae]
MPEEFTAGLDQLRPLLNPEKHGELHPKDIAAALGASSPFLVHILRLLCNMPKHPIALFACDLIFSCKNIASKLLASAQLDSFNQWGLCMSELTEHATLSETASVPKAFAAKLSTAQGQKQRASILEEEGKLADMHSSAEDGDGDSESEDAPCLKAPATKSSRASAGVPSISSSRLMEHPTVTIKNKKHLILKAHAYKKEEPVPVKAEELDTITQAAALPSYGCAQCSSSIQNQPCLFLGWGKRCNNCEAASKSVCTFHAEPVQCYFAHKELAKCVKATPENVCTCINHTSAALHVFESSANATANELSEVCAHASSSEDQDALLGMVFEDCDFEDQVHAAISRLDLQVSFPVDIEHEPSLPLDPGPSSLPAFTAIIQASSPSDSLVNSDEVQGELNKLKSSPIHPAQGESATHKAGVGLETIVNQCKAVCGIGVHNAEIVIQHPTTIIGDPKVEDAVFRMKQVFKQIQAEHLTTPTFKDYHTVRSFTGVIHSKRLKCAAAISNAIAAATGILSIPPAVPAPTAPVPAKTVATSGKGKATKVPARRSCCSAKSKATIEGSSDEEASVITAAKEDTVMGNLDASSAPPETDPVLFNPAGAHRVADTIISCFAQMNIDNELEIIVNRNPSSGNIVEGHKIPFPKFLKNKKAALAAQRDREKAGCNTLAEQAAQAIIAGEKAYEAANQARKCPCSSADLAFKDSSYTIAVADLAINNKASQSTLDAAMALVSTADHVNPSENVLRSREADLCNDVIATTHKIEYLLKYWEFVVAHHAQVVQQLESHISVPMEDTPSTLVTSSSKLD